MLRRPVLHRAWYSIFTTSTRCVCSFLLTRSCNWGGLQLFIIAEKRGSFRWTVVHQTPQSSTPLPFSCGAALVPCGAALMLSCNLPAWQRLGNERMKCRHTNEERDNDLQVMLQLARNSIFNYNGCPYVCANTRSPGQRHSPCNGEECN